MSNGGRSQETPPADLAATISARRRLSLRVRSRHRWVGFEGIVASGKTTQSARLAAEWGCAHVVPEFGDHELGRYLSRYGSPGMRLTPEGCDTSYVRHLLALSSHVQKLQVVGRESKRRPVLLDVATLTDAAFALADLPAEAAEHLRPMLRAAVNSMVAMATPPPHSGVLIYLDCDPKVAADRLARRTCQPVGTEQVDFLVRMHQAYEFLLSERRDVVRIDANGEIDQVAELVRAHVRL
jgi:thymidylate kinase